MFYAPSQDVQRPTHPRLHVRDANDAHTVFEAVRRGVLKSVTRRLNDIERANYIQSGAVFVWEESDDELGLKRWTDGRVWSQSRMREPYLFYDEKLPNEGDELNNQAQRSQAVFRFVDGTSRNNSSIFSHFDRGGNRPNGLVKQAYSAWVSKTPDSKPRKWHLTAYFKYADLQSLPTVDVDATLCNLPVPKGIYRSSKGRSRNSSVTEPPNQYPSRPSSPPVPSPSPSMNAISGSHRSYMPPPNHRNRRSSLAITEGLPPIYTAVLPGGDPLAGSKPPMPRDPRSPEDQRMINMLNSHHR